jgi:hypothetical protein
MTAEYLNKQLISPSLSTVTQVYAKRFARHSQVHTVLFPTYSYGYVPLGEVGV